MNVTSLLTRLSNFAPPSVPAPAADREPPASDDGGAPADRFGPALRVGLSEQAQKLLSQFQSAPGELAEDGTTVRIHRQVAYSPSHQPTPQQMARVYEIAARYANDVRPDAAQRMMDELRQQGLHPDQLARKIDVEAATATAEDAAVDAAEAADSAPRRAGGLSPSIANNAVTNGFTLRPAAETALVA